MYTVKPLPGREQNEQYAMVGYNGQGKPAAFIAAPEDVFFITRSTKLDPRPNASLWIIPGTEPN
jgi:hypothetical protein